MPASSDDGRPPRRYSLSLDLDCSPTKAAAWVWHVHSPQPEVTTEGRLLSHNRRRSSGGCKRKDSRFRLEAEAAAATPLPVAGRPSPLQEENLWDCGSKLYDTLELVSFSNRLDRSLLSVPAFQTPKLHHAQSPLHQPGGILRTLSLPRSMSLHRIKGETPLINGPSFLSLAVNDSLATPDCHDLRQSSIPAQKAPNRRFSAKCSAAKLAKIFKKAIILRNGMRCIGRKEPISPKQQKLHRSGSQLKQLKQCMAAEEKIDHHHQHFHHHHHYHHYLHHLAGSHQSKEAGLKDYKPSVNSQDPWSPRAESARLSSETMSKICADKNWL